MKQFKRWLSCLLVFCMVASMVPITAHAVSASGTCGKNLTWILRDNGILTISGTGDMPDYSYNSNPWADVLDSILSVVISEGVTSIGQYAFHGCTNLNSVDIPDSVTAISRCAFYDCVSLPSVDIPESVTSIGDSAFLGCTNLISVVIPDSVTSIGSSAFQGCTSLTQVSIPLGVSSIEEKTFNYCESLIHVDIPDGVTSIGDEAFYDCSSLVSIDIPESVTTIGNEAFRGCNNLTSIDIPDSVTHIGSGAFFSCSSLTSVDIPENIVSIGGHVFQLCSKLQSVYIPDSITAISDYTFYGCASLPSVDIPESVTSIGDGAFSNCTNLIRLDIPDSVTTIGDEAFRFCENLDKLDIPNSVTTIGNGAFNNCFALTSINIPDGVNTIGNEVFSGCHNLSNVDIPHSVTSIGDSAFENCMSLSKIDIPDSVTSIGNYAFKQCSYLSNVEIPNSVTSIGDGAFYGCTSLFRVDVPHSVTSIGNEAFSECRTLTKIYVDSNNPEYSNDTFGCLFNKNKTILYRVPGAFNGIYTVPGGVTTIDDYAFAYCYDLTDVYIPDSVTSIESHAFFYCRNLTSVNIPYGITSIGDNTFDHCKLLSVDIPETVTSIGDAAFHSCDKLNNLDIPDSVTHIGYQTFYLCKGLTKVSISASISVIGSEAFAYNYNLTEIVFRGNAPTFGYDEINGVFYGVTATAYYPSNNPTWTADVMQDYGGDITWVPYEGGEVPEVPTPAIDTDGDGLLDEWETNGLDYDDDGIIDVPLHLMGADPYVPDIYVEIDWMYREKETVQVLGIPFTRQDEINLSPSAKVREMVYQQFANHGINLHIDCGPDSVDYVTGKKWGELSGGNSLEYEKNTSLGIQYENWQAIAEGNFANERAYIFRYCIFINRYNNSDSSGLASNIPGQYFIVADVDGALSKIGDIAIAGTFMHELGHTLGLSHGGITLDGTNDHTHYKPNYLSIMNYLFQLSGLVGVDGVDAINYSEYELPEINENTIDENNGIDPLGIISNNKLGTKWNKGKDVAYSVAGSPIDFNKSSIYESNISLDINADGRKGRLLPVVNDWEHIIFKGGTIGDFGNEIVSVDIAANDSIIQLNQEIAMDEAYENGLFGNPGDCAIEDVGPMRIFSGVSGQEVIVVLRNLNTAVTTPTLRVTSDVFDSVFEKTVEIGGTSSDSNTISIPIPVTNLSLKNDSTVTVELICENGITKETSATISVVDPVIIELETGETEELITDNLLGEVNNLWESKDDNVATIENGIIIAKNPGETYIYGYFENGETLVCLVKVTEKEHTHIYVSPTYSWTEDNKCTATFTCLEGDDTHTIECTISSVTTPATETDAGKIVYTASVEFNSQIYVDTKIVEIPPAGHSYESKVTTEPTCTGKGIKTFTCACGDSYTEEIPAKGHTLTQVEAKAATCEEAGYEAYEFCSACDYTTYEEIPAKGHTYEAVVTDPTCEDKGYTTYTCVCGDSYVGDEVAVLGHDMKETSAKVDATCETDGKTAVLTCANGCGKTEGGVKIDALGHSEESVAGKDATCTENGLTDGKKCTVCGTVTVEQTVIEALGHDWSDWVITKEATTTEEGTKERTCGNCGEKETETIPVVKPDHEHSYTKVVTAPTCEDKGYTTYTCACGDSYIADEVAALGHNKVIDQGYDATCTKTGLTDGKQCSRCKKILVAQIITPALGHDWDEGTVTKEPTRYEVGVTTYTCDRCDHIKTEEIPCLTLEIIRIAGRNRVQTAIAAADVLKAKLGVEKFETIILASGGEFADALVGSYLANVKGAPILLYHGKNSVDENLTYIQNNLTEDGKVYILGGTAAIPEAVESALTEAGIDAERIQGNNRFETNLKILEAAGVQDEEILICTGWNYADCLSASATGLPILMVNTNRDVLTDAQIEFLTAHKDNAFTIIGGTGAVSEAMENAIAVIVGDVERAYGNNREVTSLAIAERYFETADCVFVAFSRNFPDGLCGGPVAYAYGVPLLLVNKNQEQYAADYVYDRCIAKGFVLGGTAVVSEDVVRTVFAIAE